MVVVDVDKKALERMKYDIYPSRYGAWSDKIIQYQIEEEPRCEYNLICIGTPPDTHLNILLNSLSDYKGKTLLEKPLCEPTNQAIKKLNQLTKSNSDNIYVGYNHVISKANRIVKNIKKK